MIGELVKSWEDFRSIEILADVGHWEQVFLKNSDGSHRRPKPLKAGERAIYAFYTSDEVLKVGQTKYPQRFTSQHYGSRRSGSTLARDLEANRGAFGIGTEDTQRWMYENLGRANIVFPPDFPADVVRMLECFLHFRLSPRFEGTRA